ncbi:unnamed protein product [Prorocentrum cordatum]|uniref:Subtilisin n=1 Tax=Prorocentrum cordatum TaxID=2364126 RepID=A0ABN9U974_9DINO|nr:unnamed protein product [Polarella glacialis]
MVARAVLPVLLLVLAGHGRAAADEASTTDEDRRLEATSTADVEDGKDIVTTIGGTGTIKIAGSYVADEVLPSGVTSDDLMASAVYVDAKAAGLAGALNVAVYQVEIMGFIVNLVARRLTAASTVSITTLFSITVDESAGEAFITLIEGAADEIVTYTNNAMAAADWSSETVITSAPTLANIVVRTASSWILHRMTYCPEWSSGGVYSSVAEAQAACSSDDCFGVYDKGCDGGTDDVFLCSSDHIATPNDLQKSWTSCVYSKAGAEYDASAATSSWAWSGAALITAVACMAA